MGLRNLSNIHLRPLVSVDGSLLHSDVRIYHYLYDFGPKTTREIADALHISRETVRQSLRRLEQTKWVFSHLGPGRIRGRVYYAWMPPEKEEMMASLLRQRRTTTRFYGEWLMRVLLDLFVPIFTYLDNACPDWLITPTGVRLELDRWYIIMNIAFEFQGQQHFQKGDKFVRTNEDLSRRFSYDGEKVRLCTLHNVHLVEITAADLDVDVFCNKLKGKLPLAPIPESGPLYRQVLGMTRQYLRHINRAS